RWIVHAVGIGLRSAQVAKHTRGEWRTSALSKKRPQPFAQLRAHNDRLRKQELASCSAMHRSSISRDTVHQVQ
ncbi:MAG: hypothetical protein ACJ78J_07165, partial [Gemmatimonadaceae bacterium]